MDSRDCSSTSSMAVTRDGGSAADDDGALSAAAKLGKESALLFQSGKYAECVDVLKQLLQKKEADPKVLHNIALAEFFRDGCLDTKRFLQALVNIKKRYEDLACASGEQLGTTMLPANRTATGPKSNSTGLQVPEANMVYSDESDACLTTLNMAIVLYHLHDYPKAMSLLDSLFQHIEPLDEVTALHVCLLLLDTAVYTQDVAKFADVISYLEKAFGLGNISNQADNGSNGQHPPSNLVLKSSSIPSSVTATEDLNSDSLANASENSLSRTLSDETIDYDNLFSSLDIAAGGGGVKYQKQPRLPVSDGSDRSSFVDLKLKLPLYKVQHLLLMRNLKAAKRELKLAMNIVRGRDSSIALLLKSQLELGRGNDMKAEKLLKASHSQHETGNSILYDNNMGCVFFQWGKFHAAGVFFHKALLACSSYRKEHPRNLTSFSLDKTVLIMYNSGLQYLACGQPVLAAQCLQKASLVFYKRPQLWIRLAECCLMARKKGMLESFEVVVIGQGKWRHLAVMSGSSKNDDVLRSREKVKPTLASGSIQAPDLSVSYARDCLLNALGILRCFERKQVKSGSSVKHCQEENKSGDGLACFKNVNHRNSNGGVDTKIGSKDSVSFSQVNANGDVKVQKGGSNSSLAEYDDMCRREWCMMKQAVLADLAFIELELGNPVAALTWAHSLLQVSESSKTYSFLARVYAAESFCLLNRPREAAEQLSVYFSGESVELPYSKDDCEQWHSQWQVNKPLDSEELNTVSRSGLALAKGHSAKEWHDNVFRKPEEAQGTLYLNLAAMYSMQGGDLERARQYCERALSLVPNSKEAHLMGVYLDLKQGKVEEGRTRLRRCNCVTFVSQGGSRLKGSSS